MNQPAIEEDEILDLVDANDTVIGTIAREVATSPGGLKDGQYIRAANCFIVNSKGQLWIPRRTAHKKIAPNGLDYSTGGHVSTGQTYEQTMLQELAEEVNLHINPNKLVLIGKETPFNSLPGTYFANVYLYFSDETPNYNPDDFTGFEWLSISELQHKLRNGEPAKDSLLAATEYVSAYMLQHGRDH